MLSTKPFNISKTLVMEAFKNVKANAGSAGVDKVSIEMYEKNLKDNLYKLWNRMSSGSYFPPPVMGLAIPKKSGGERLLGIPTVADRVAQTAVKMVLEPQLEAVFLPDSYGYRPGKSAHDAIGITRERCWRYEWLVEFDIKGLFDNIPWDLLMKAVKRHTDCQWILLYIERWLKAPMRTEDGKEINRTKGTPQGGVVSPVLSNLFLHYCFDKWISIKHPSVPWCRYADDGLFHCQSHEQARAILDDTMKRFKDCGLDLHPEKTKIVYCKSSKNKIDYPIQSFDFLGYTFQNRSAKNSNTGEVFTTFTPAISKKSLKNIKHRIKHGWRVKSMLQCNLQDIAKMVNPIIRGWVQYYGKYNKSKLAIIYRYINMILKKWGQRKYKKLRESQARVRKWLKNVYEANPKLFYHWNEMAVY